MSVSREMSERDHRAVRELLPFYVNRTLSDFEQTRVSRHLVHCASCRAEAEEQRLLVSVLRAVPERPSNAAADWSRLEQRLAEEQSSRWFGARLHSASWSWTRMAWPLRLTTAAVAVILLVALWTGERSSHEPAYRTLSSAPDAPAAAAAIRVVFSPQATALDIRELLDRTRYQIVSGPSSRGVYTLAPSVTQVSDSNATLAALRDSPLVALAEPVASAGVDR